MPAEYMNYIKLDPIEVNCFNLPEKYAVITTGYTSDTRVFKAEYINEVAEYLNSIGITPVFLGKKATYADKNNTIVGKFEANYELGVNLIDKTNLFEAHSIMSKAQFVLGLDNGLLHLASMSDVSVIWGFTTVLPEHRLPYRNNIKGFNAYVVSPTEEELACWGCQSKMNFADSSHSFMTCIYSDFKCVELMTSDKWITQINRVIFKKACDETFEKFDTTLQALADTECTCNGLGILENHDDSCPKWEP